MQNSGEQSRPGALFEGAGAYAGRAVPRIEGFSLQQQCTAPCQVTSTQKNAVFRSPAIAARGAPSN